MRALIRASAGIAAVLCLAGASRPPESAALARIEPGRWMLRDLADPDGTHGLCVADPAMLLQLRHGAASCSRFVIASSADAVTVQYSCPGAGQGRTTVSVENPRLIQVESQGIADGRPFELRYEGRRIGACAAGRGR